MISIFSQRVCIKYLTVAPLNNQTDRTRNTSFIFFAQLVSILHSLLIWHPLLALTCHVITSLTLFYSSFSLYPLRVALGKAVFLGTTKDSFCYGTHNDTGYNVLCGFTKYVTNVT